MLLLLLLLYEFAKKSENYTTSHVICLFILFYFNMELAKTEKKMEKNI